MLKSAANTNFQGEVLESIIEVGIRFSLGVSYIYRETKFLLLMLKSAGLYLQNLFFDFSMVNYKLCIDRGNF